MLRRIIGITGISLWTGLIVFVGIGGFGGKANGEPMFENLAEGWEVESSFAASRDQTAAVSRRLGGRITKLTNTVISFKGQKLQVNVMNCPTSKDADIIYQAILDVHNRVSAAVVRRDNTVIEFAKSEDVSLMNRARRALSLPDARLDSVAGKLIKKIPDGWQIENSFIVPRGQTAAIGKKLGGRIKNLSNTIFSVGGQRFQVNVVECATPRAAQAIYISILGMKDDPAFCLKYGNTVVEFIDGDVELAKKAPYELGFGMETEETMEETGQLDINAKVAKLNIRTATLDRVIRIFGKPTKYIWGNETFERSNLPDRYILDYPDGFSILMMNGRIVEHRHEGPDGYIWQGKLRVGSSLDEVLTVVGRPKKTVEGQPNEFEDSVLYKDIDGEEGTCYYGRERKGVRFFFIDYKVSSLYVTRNDLSGRRSTLKTKAPLAETKPQPVEIEAQAKNLVQLLVDGDFARAAKNFDAAMKKALPPEKLEEVWDSLTGQVGPFIEQLGVRKEKILQYEAVFVTCKFERAVLDAKVVFDRSKQITGLFFVPSQESAK